MAVILRLQTVGSIIIASVDINPSIGVGLDLPIGSIATVVDGSGIYYKFGALNNQWYNYSSISGIYNGSNVDTSITGSLLETVLVNLKVNGGSMGANGVLSFESELAKIGTNAGGSIKMYISTIGSNNIGNTGVPVSSTLIGTYFISAPPQCPQRLSRKIANKNSESFNYIFNTTQPSTNTYIASSNSARTLLNINTSNDFWITITCSLASILDTIIIQNTQIYINKKIGQYDFS